MTSFSFKPAIAFSLSELADLFTRSFEGYFVTINLDEITLHTMLRRGGVDLSESRVFLNEGRTHRAGHDRAPRLGQAVSRQWGSSQSRGKAESEPGRCKI